MLSWIFFDYITGISIGSIAAEMATELEEPWKPLTAMAIYGLVSLLLSVISNKFPRSRKYLNGTPTILMDHGKLYHENMKKAKLDLSEFMVMCRQQGYFDLTSIQTTVFEYNGKLTILPVSNQRPVTPNDMNLAPAQELLFTELIMDGRILDDNLKRLGLDLTWLDKQLKQRRISSPQDVFLAVCDRNLKFVLYEKSHNKSRHSDFWIVAEIAAGIYVSTECSYDSRGDESLVNSCELTVFITAIANALACKLNEDEVTLLA